MSIELELRNLGPVREYFETAPVRTRTELTNALRKSSIQLQRIGREEAPIDRGNLRRSIEVRWMELAFAVGPRANYAHDVHEGRAPGQMSETEVQSLAEWARRKRLPVYPIINSVRRKGTKANPFMDRTEQRGRADVHRFFDQAVAAIVEAE